MRPDELERALRDSLSRRAASTPAPVDPAATAIRRGRRIRRRRTVGGVATAAVATVLASAGVVQFGSPAAMGPATALVGDPPFQTTTAAPATSPATALMLDLDATPSASPAGPPVIDLVDGRTLSAADGHRIDVAAVGVVSAARRTPGGWLMTSSAPSGRVSLWYVTADRPARRVLADVDAIAVAPDGQRVSWRDGGELAAGTLSDGEFSTTTRSPAPPRGEPVGFVGVAVLLRQVVDGGAGGPRFDLWWPTAGDFVASWTTVPTDVYGELPGGSELVGRIVPTGSASPCLALLDVHRHLLPTRTACDLPLTAGERGSVSPDGRWLLANGRPAGAAAGAAETAFVIDLAAVFGSATPTSPPTKLSRKAGAASPSGAAAAVRSAGQPLVSDPVWTGPATAVHLDGQGGLVRVGADPTGSAALTERFPGPGDPTGRPLIVTGLAS